MGINEFWRQHPPGMALDMLVWTNYINTWSVHLDSPEETVVRSPVVILAERIAEAGRKSLIDLNNILGYDGTLLTRYLTAGCEDLSAEDKTILDINHAAIIFGTVMLNIEKTLITREFRVSDFYVWYEAYSDGNPLETIGRYDRSYIEELSIKQWEKMIELSKKDKTLSIFFQTEGLDSLPSSLRKMIQDSRLIGHIQEFILPKYFPRAQTLLDSSKNRPLSA